MCECENGSKMWNESISRVVVNNVRDQVRNRSVGHNESNM